MSITHPTEPQHSFHIVPGTDLDLNTKHQIRELHARCYPGEQDPEDSLEAAFDQICFLHEADDCVWFLLFAPAVAATALAAPKNARRLVGMCAGVPYHDSLYVFAFGVDPAFRRMGYGKRIMFGIEVWAFERQLPHKVSATVDAAAAQLIAFYESLGAVVERNSVTSAGAPPPPSLRMVKRFDEAEARSGLAAAEREILRASERRRRRRRQLVIAAHVVAAVAVVGGAALLLRAARRRGGSAGVAAGVAASGPDIEAAAGAPGEGGLDICHS